jgi:predicted transcriptional regulator
MDFDLDDVGGLVVPIEGKYLSKIAGGPFVYVKGEGYGKFIKSGDVVLFYRTRSTGYKEGIIGYGPLECQEISPPSEAWKNHERLMKMDKDDFDRFAKSKNNLLVLKIGSYVEYKEPITIEEFYEITGIQLSDSNPDSRYVSKGAIEKLSTRSQKSTKEVKEKQLKHIGR